MLSRFVIAFLWELDHEEGWAPRNWCFRIVVLEKEQGDQTSQSKGNKPWIFIRRTDIEAAILWPPDTNSQLIGKDPDAGKDWRQEKGVTEDEMVGLHHWFNGHKFVQTLGDGEGQGNLACCSPWGHKESDTKLSDWATSYFLYVNLTQLLCPRNRHYKILPLRTVYFQLLYNWLAFSNLRLPVWFFISHWVHTEDARMYSALSQPESLSGVQGGDNKRALHHCSIPVPSYLQPGNH